MIALEGKGRKASKQRPERSLLSWNPLFPLLAFIVGFLSLWAWVSTSRAELPERFVTPATVEGKVTTVEAYNPEAGYPMFKVLQAEGGDLLALYGPLSEELASGAKVKLKGVLARGAGEIPLVAERDFYVTEIETQRVRSGVSGRSIVSRPTGTRGVMIAFLKWNDRNPDPDVVTPPLYGWPDEDSPQTAFDALKGDLETLDDWSGDASDGRFNLDPVTVVELDLGEFGVPYDCAYVNNPINFVTLVLRVRNALAARDGFPENYGALGVVMPADFPQECFFNGSAAAFAFYSSGCTWNTDPVCGLSIYQSRYAIKPVFIHELGHNLDLPHAHSLPCRLGSGRVSLSYQTGGCLSSADQTIPQPDRTAIEYGDKFDLMGDTYTSGSSLLNPAFSDQLGWLATDEVERISTPQDRSVSLGPYGNLSGKRAIEVNLPKVASAGNTSPGKLWVEYRDRPSEDTTDINLFERESVGGLQMISGCPEGPDSRLYLRLILSQAGYELLDVGSTRGISGRGPIADNSFLLDMNPSTATFCDAGMNPGQSWTDPTGRLKVEFNGRTLTVPGVAGSASVRVKLEADPSNSSPPPASPAPSPSPSTEAETLASAKLGRLKVKGPSKVRRGKVARFTVTVHNAGTAPATGIKISASGAGSSARSTVSSLNAGASKKLGLSLRLKKAGRVKVSFRATSSNAGNQSVRKTIRVR